jgi:hypothetical protein
MMLLSPHRSGVRERAIRRPCTAAMVMLRTFELGYRR